MTNYPSGIDNNITLPTVAVQTQTPIVDGSAAGGDLTGTYPNPTILNIQGNPVLASGAHQPSPNQVLQWNGTAWVPGSGGGSGSFIAGGDLSGTNLSQRVIGLQGRSLSSAAPSVGQIIAWNGAQWIPTTPSSGGAAGGDLTGTYPNPTIAKLQGTTLSVGSPSSGQIITFNGTAWVAASFTGTAGGDLSGTYPNPTVSGLQGRSVTATAPSTGQVLTWNGAAWAPGSATTFTAGGDLSGTNTSQTVIAINGATVPVSGSLVTGNVLQVSGTSALMYGPVNLAGGSNFVSGTLPAGNLPPATTIALGVIQLAGDLAGTDTVPRVVSINRSSVPAGGSLTVGNVLQVSGTSSLTYSALNLAGGANFVTGILPAGNIPAPLPATNITASAPTTGQFVIAASSSGYQTYTITGDISADVVTPGDLTVVGIQQVPVPTPVGTVVDGYDTVLTYTGSVLTWATVGSGGFPTGPALGDLGGSYPAPKVVGLQTYPIHNQVLGGIDDGYILTFGSDGYWSAQPPVGGVPTGSAGGDLGGSYPSPLVVALQGNAILSQTLTSIDDGYVLTWHNATRQWEALPTSDTISLFGDVNGTASASTVVALQGNPILAQTLTSIDDGYVLTWHNATDQWEALPTNDAISLSGDVVGTANTNTVIHLTGSGGVIPFEATIKGDPTYNSNTGFPISYSVAAVVMPSDANYTLTNTQLVSPILRVTSSVSLTVTRQVILPNVTGAEYHVYNNTTGGQSLTFIGSSGLGVTVPNGLKTTVYFDGTNYVTAGIVIGGDLFASVNTSQTVIKIQGNPVLSQILTAADDGYVLTWHNAADAWEALPAAASVTSVQTGYNYGEYLNVNAFPPQNTNSTTFVNAGTFEFDPTAITAANGTRTIKLRVNAETTTPQMTIQLYNLTAASVVTGSTLTTTSTVPVTLTTGDLTANLTNGLATYQIQIEMAGGGGPSDEVTLNMGYLKVTWS